MINVYLSLTIFCKYFSIIFIQILGKFRIFADENILINLTKNFSKEEMEHTDKYLKTEDMMLNVIGCVEQYSESRFIASLYTRSYTKIDIQIAINDVRSCLMLVHGELLRLSKYSLEFLDQWATRDNQRFTTAEKMFNRLRSSMAYLRRQYRKSSPIVRGKPTHNPLLMPSVFRDSVLTYGDCPRDLFKIESYNNDVQTLYVEQRALFGNILAALNLCYGVIKAEKEIGNSLEECERRFDRQLNEITNMLQDYMGQFQSNDGGVIQQQIERFGKQAFVKQGWHKYEIKDIRQYAVYLLTHPDKSIETTSISMLWPNDPVKSEAALLLAKHFADIRYDEKKKKASGMKIWLYICWCGSSPEIPDRKFYDFLAANFTGELSDWHNVIVTKNRFKGDVAKELSAFSRVADMLLKQIEPTERKVV